MNRLTRWCALLGIGFTSSLGIQVMAAETTGIIDLKISNGTKQLQLPLVPGVEQFKVRSTPSLNQPFNEESSGSIKGYGWSQSGLDAFRFYQVEMSLKDSNAVVGANLLNRLGYGPTPDDLEHVQQIGPDVYIQEQLAPEKIQEDLEIDRVQSTTDWQQIIVTGTASSSLLYIYMTGNGDCYVDDIKIVSGNVAENGVNKVQNGSFETSLAGWTVSANLTNSTVVSDVFHAGTSSLHVVSTSEGTTRGSSIYRTDLGLALNQPYTLSYWFKPGTSKNSSLIIRLSDNGILSSPGSLATRLANSAGNLNDLTAWHALHAVQSRRQLLEMLLQFSENHFVTQQSKSRDYMDRYYDGDQTDVMATSLEYQELTAWRRELLKPDCTFQDLLKVSAESPAMIIYLDTINSKGNAGNIANENYARELLELFTFGVDNGYDQNDITVMSRVWTGWSIELVDRTNQFNPFASKTANLRPGITNASNGSYTNLDGIWAFNYKPQNHNNEEKIIFPGKTVPARFGAPYAGRNYELKIPPPERGTDWQYVTKSGTIGTNGTLPIYLYLAGSGDCYIDDLQLVAGRVAEEGPNLISNGTFDSGLTGWTLSTIVRGSSVSTDIKHSGAGALHLVSTAAGSSQGTSMWQSLALDPSETYTLSYWYRPGTTMTGDLVVRTSGNAISSTPPNYTSIQEGYKVVEHLANQPFTQEFISVKLCRLFVHDDFSLGYDFTDPNLSPEGRLVRDCMHAWEENVPKGQIRKVLEVIFNSELFRTQAASMQKVKTPFEFTVSAIRALRSKAPDGTWTANSDGYSIRAPINRMGRMRLFDRAEPDGYPEAAAPWISAGTLMERLRFVQALLLPGTSTPKNDNSGNANTTDPVKLLKAKLPSSSWKDANAVASYFTGILYPSEGKANLDDYRSQAVHYLDTADDGATSSPFSALTDTSSAYDLRVRGMVAMLMTFQRFQEQ